MKSCGICDNCLKKKNTSISKDEFSIIENRILTMTKEPVDARELIHHLNGIKKDKVWKVIEYLQAEKKIEVNASGMVRKISR
jgi:ATP-dependent DNA helicase RecQ